MAIKQNENFGQAGLTVSASTLRDAGQDELDRVAAALFGLFLEREKAFGFSAEITTEYPDIAEPGSSPFLANPAAFIGSRMSDLSRENEPIGRVVVLTTFGDRLDAPLRAAGYRSTPIDMPAGPDFTWWFEKEWPVEGRARTLYLEAVDEGDPKIRPSFVLELNDGEGRLRGGACGSIHSRQGRNFCYLATMAVDAGLPPATGLKLGQAMLEFLFSRDVDTVHLGTQTAGPFYEKLGFAVSHRVLPGLRVRQGSDGALITTDLVMMERALP